MYSEARLSQAVAAVVQSAHAPPVPLGAIRARIAARSASPRRFVPAYPAALAALLATVALFAAFPSQSLSVAQTLEERYRSALEALGGTAPVPAPSSLLAQLTAQSASVETAQSRVNFRIVPPAGLPHDVRSVDVKTVKTGEYSETTHTWSVGAPDVTFNYGRADGRTFTLIADKYDPRTGLPPKYMFEDRGDDVQPNGHIALVRRLHFAWRNGDQVMSASAGDGISAGEIAAIRDAMRGVELPARDLRVPSSGTVQKLYRLP